MTNITMGELSQYMIQQENTAEFARSRVITRRLGRRKKGLRVGGKAVGLAALGAGIGAGAYGVARWRKGQGTKAGAAAIEELKNNVNAYTPPGKKKRDTGGLSMGNGSAPRRKRRGRGNQASRRRLKGQAR